jgi:hypothetical protein
MDSQHLWVVTRMLGVEVTGLGLSDLAQSCSGRLADLLHGFEVIDLLSIPIESVKVATGGRGDNTLRVDRERDKS